MRSLSTPSIGEKMNCISAYRPVKAPKRQPSSDVWPTSRINCGMMGMVSPMPTALRTTVERIANSARFIDAFTK